MKKAKKNLIGSRHVNKRLIPIKIDGKTRHLVHLKRTYRELFRFAQLSTHPPKDFIFPEKIDPVDSEDSLRNIHLLKRRTVKHRDGSESKKTERLYKTLPDKSFEEFWKLNRHLFLEPIEEEMAVEVVKDSITNLSDNNYLYLKVNLQDTDLALFQAQSIIERHRRLYKFISKAKYRLGTPQRLIRLEKLLAYRIAYIHRQYHLHKEQRKNVPDRLTTYQHLIDLDLVKPIYVSKFNPTPIFNPSTGKLEMPTEPERDSEQERRKISFYCARVRKIIENIESENFRFP